MKKIILAITLVMILVSPVWAEGSSENIGTYKAPAPYKSPGGLQRAPDGTYVSVPAGGQAVRAPDGTYVATGPTGMTERAPDGSWHGTND